MLNKLEKTVMRNKYLIDTSFISSLANKNDANHVDAISIYDKLYRNATFLSTYSVLLELVVIQNANPLTIIDFLEKICSDLIVINKSFIENFLKYFQFNSFKLKAIDASILYACYEYNAVLLSFDKKLLEYYTLIS